MPNQDGKTYIALSAAAAVYAAWLNTEKGRRFADDHTWASVVLGTGLVLAALKQMIPPPYWRKVLLAFIVAGTPLVGRSLFRQLTIDN
jgi:hypothetical protein